MFFLAMNFERTIKLNQKALRRVVEEIFAILELVLDGTSVHLPPILQAMAIRLLVPAESALRRLIIIAAQGLKVTAPPTRPMPQGKRIVTKFARPLSFQLYDTRKRFNRPMRRSKTIEPRIHVFAFSPLIANLLPQAKKQKTSQRLCRRFEAFKLALENIPHQAKRLVKWQAKRALKKDVKFRSPLRPGAPPGFRRSLNLEIDRVLRQCHDLAIGVLREAPS